MGEFWYNFHDIIKTEGEILQHKKYLIILVLKLLETESDSSHPISQSQMARIISDVYPCDRKTVGRNIAVLSKVGYPIEKTSKGFYLHNKAFTIDEREFVLKAINASNEKSAEEKADITMRLTRTLNMIYRQD